MMGMIEENCLNRDGQDKKDRQDKEKSWG